MLACCGNVTPDTDVNLPVVPHTDPVPEITVPTGADTKQNEDADGYEKGSYQAADGYEKGSYQAAEEENSLQERLEEAFKLSLPCEDVNQNNHKIRLTSEGMVNAKKIAAILKEDATVCVRVLGYSGKGDDLSKCVRLSFDRTRAIRNILEDEGCVNKVAVRGLGFADDKGPRCELALCTLEEAEAVEAEALELERLAKAIPPGPRTFEVHHSRIGKDSYGIIFDCRCCGPSMTGNDQGAKLPVVNSIIAGGMIDGWNSNAPLEKQVAVGMALVAVDGKAEPTVVSMINMPGSWTMTFKVPREFKVTLKKDGGTGLHVRKCSEMGSALMVESAEAQAAAAGLKPNDRIMEVNGQKGISDELLRVLISAEDEVTLKVHSFTEE